jgi:hypothetical protein
MRKHTYNAGDSWTEGTTLHDVVNHSSLDAHFIVTYVVAKGVSKRTDQAAPACAAALERWLRQRIRRRGCA